MREDFYVKKKETKKKTGGTDFAGFPTAKWKKKWKNAAKIQEKSSRSGSDAVTEKKN